MTFRGSPIRLFTGSAHPALAHSIANILGIPVAAARVGKFSNGESQVEVIDSARDCDVFIVQPTSGLAVNDSIMEMLILVDAVRRESARRITAVIPCFAYARQDKKDKSRVPITGKLIANLIQVSGIDRLITIDLHASQIQGFFDIPVDNLFAEALIAKYIEKIGGDLVIVSPDAGGVKRAKSVADKLNLDLAIIHKERQVANHVVGMTLVGNVQRKACILIDDMADTCGTLKLAASTLKAHGAIKVIAAVTHGVFSGSAFETLQSSELDDVIVTNSLPQVTRDDIPIRLKVIDIAPMLAEAIRRIHNGESISVLFNL